MKRMGLIILTVALSAAIATACKSTKKAATVKPADIYEVSLLKLEAGLAHKVDLGRISEGEIVTKKIVIKNATYKPFAITNILAGCPCLSFAFTREPVQPQGEMTIELTFDSRGFAGEIVRNVDVFTTLAEKTLWLEINCTII